MLTDVTGVSLFEGFVTPHHPVIELIIVGVAALLIYFVLSSVWDGGAKHRKAMAALKEALGGFLMSKAREAKVKQIASQLITDALEEADYTGQITAEEKLSLYYELGTKVGMPDLLPGHVKLPKKRSKELKKELKDRSLKRNGSRVAIVPLPDVVKPVEKETTRQKLQRLLSRPTPV